jgi:DHA1 family bicyclomycin/chloramphenicol resistance-like MFS transporter
MGTLQLVVGAIVIGAMGVFSDGRPLPMVLGMAACAVIAFVLGRVTLPHAAVIEQPTVVPMLLAEPESD